MQQGSAWRLWGVALVLVLGLAGGAYASMCPKGFMRFSGYAHADRFSCIDYGGISTPEHYINLKNGGRVALFGGPFKGEGGHPFLMRTSGDMGKWICGTTKEAKFSLNSGEVVVDQVTTILDEATATRTGNMTLTGLGGGVFGDGCKGGSVSVDGNVLKLDLMVTSSAGGANQEYTRIDLAVSGKGLRIFMLVDLEVPWPERGDTERVVANAWVRLTEVIGGRQIRRIAVAGPGSRLVRKDGCATLELTKVTPLAACPGDEDPAGAPADSLTLSW